MTAESCGGERLRVEIIADATGRRTLPRRYGADGNPRESVVMRTARQMAATRAKEGSVAAWPETSLLERPTDY